MKKVILSLLAIALISCEYEPEHPDNLVGEWKINWSGFNEIRTGTLVLNADQTAQLFLAPDPQSTLIPDAESIAITWKIDDYNLTLTRDDNNFSLKYHLISKSANIIQLDYLEELDVTLER